MELLGSHLIPLGDIRVLPHPLSAASLTLAAESRKNSIRTRSTQAHSRAGIRALTCGYILPSRAAMQIVTFVPLFKGGDFLLTWVLHDW